MPKFKFITVETTTYVHYVEADNEDKAWDNFDSSSVGEEIDHAFELTEITEVEDHA